MNIFIPDFRSFNVVHSEPPDFMAPLRKLQARHVRSDSELAA